MADVQLSVLGPLTAHRDGAEVALGGRRQPMVLATLLAARGRMLPAERLRNLVWSDGGRTAGPATLHGYVAGLRRALEPDRPPRSPSTVLLREGPGYAVRVPAEQVDAERFTALVAHGVTMLERGRPAAAVTTLTGALGLWRGPAYADLAEASFVLPEIARLDGLRAAATESRLTAALALGRHAEVLGELEALVLEQPLRERGWELLAIALYRAGRQGDALTVVRRARTRLARDLGVDPGPGLLRLEAAILGQDTSLDLPAGRAAPLEVPYGSGRSWWAPRRTAEDPSGIPADRGTVDHTTIHCEGRHRAWAATDDQRRTGVRGQRQEQLRRLRRSVERTYPAAASPAGRNHIRRAGRDAPGPVTVPIAGVPVTRTAAEPTGLTPQWRAWTAENLALGVPAGEVREALLAAGLSGSTVDEELTRMPDHPYFQACLRLAREYAWLESLLDFYSDLRSAQLAGGLERRAGLSAAEFFDRYYFAHRPVILAGAVDDWPARQQWSPTSLRDRLGEVEVEVMTGRDSNPEHGWQHDAHRTRMTFADYLTMVETGGETNDYYMVARNDNWQHGLKPLTQDIKPVPGIIDPALLPEAVTLLLGPAGTVTALHHDNMNILLCQVMGRKHVRLVPSYQRPRVYPRGGTYSHVDAARPDLDQHPLYGQATVLAGVLEPGDALFVPAGWWHWVRALDISATVSLHHFQVPSGNHYLHPPLVRTDP
ncbi:cupin-like domain-containing protein [Micromonospora sp. NPDC023814]|uniref:cupin-like domain-containing protein n=1 Tax=Micromonospora sp. NPDC023814 TaxID=3154596 RepID=UPI0033F5103A